MNDMTFTKESACLDKGRTRLEIVEAIRQLVPPGSPEPRDPALLTQLQRLTRTLINEYKSAGRLSVDPFAQVAERQLQLCKKQAVELLSKKTVLVTGGLGCVGRNLIPQLLALGARRVISVDRKLASPTRDKVVLYQADLCSLRNLMGIFEVEKPTIVFHLAAQRSPGIAEYQVNRTIRSNVFGTQNLIQCCEKYNVTHCVYSSTGKASRYFTTEVYAASKKVAEWQFDYAARTGRTIYGMVRFTHILENSNVRQHIRRRVAQGRPVTIHGPDRTISPQNVGEAVDLLVDGLVFSEPGCLKMAVVRNLVWPVEVLEAALWEILASAKPSSLYFDGLPDGYNEPSFRGEIDWDRKQDLNVLINVLESRTILNDPTDDIIITKLAPFSDRTLHGHLSSLKRALRSPSSDLKSHLAQAIRAVATSQLQTTQPTLLLKIIKWGLEPRYLQSNGLSIQDFAEVSKMLATSLVGQITQESQLALISRLFLKSSPVLPPG